MENASKALIMAAAVLIGVMIISLAVYLFLYFGSYAEGVENQNNENQISQFNSQFLSYQGKEGLTIYDVISIANMAKDYNAENGFYDTNDLGYIQVSVPGTISSKVSSNPSLTNTNNINLIDNRYIYNGDKTLIEYKCTSVEINSTTRKVSKIIINN